MLNTEACAFQICVELAAQARFHVQVYIANVAAYNSAGTNVAPHRINPPPLFS